MIKQSALKLMTATGAFAPFRWANRGGALILLYHRFGEARDGVTVPPRALARQVAYLKAHYRLVPLSFIADHLNAGRRLPRGLAVITIDDGYRDFYEAAFPILQRERVPATVFLVTDFISQQAWMPADRIHFITAQAPVGEFEVSVGDRRLNYVLGGPASRAAAAAGLNAALATLSHEERELTMARIAALLRVRLPVRPPEQFGAFDWEQAREMARAQIEFGSHTRTHPALTGVGREKLWRELHESRLQIEDELGRVTDLFSYPHGEVDGRVRDAVERTGYRCAAGSEVGFNGGQSDRLALRRIQAEPDLPHFVQVSSGCEQVKNRLRGLSPIANQSRQTAVAGSK